MTQRKKIIIACTHYERIMPGDTTNKTLTVVEDRNGDIERAMTMFANLKFVSKNSSMNTTGNDKTRTISHLRPCHRTMTSQYVCCTVCGKRRSRLVIFVVLIQGGRPRIIIHHPLFIRGGGGGQGAGKSVDTIQ